MINTYNETLLHEALKDLYCGDDGETEVEVAGSICDVVRPDGSIVEVQTAGLGRLKGKLEKLLANRPVLLVHPIPDIRYIETYGPDHILKSRRKSPKKGSPLQVFGELTSLWHLVGRRGFEIELVFCEITEMRVADGTGSWRRRGVRPEDKRLDSVRDRLRLSKKKDYAALLPKGLPDPFSVADLAKAGAGREAGRMAWVLRKMGIVDLAGKKGNAYLYRRSKGKKATEKREA